MSRQALCVGDASGFQSTAGIPAAETRQALLVRPDPHYAAGDPGLGRCHWSCWNLRATVRS